MKPAKFIILLFLILCFSPPSFALRCGHELVDIGDNQEDVIDKCGEPESIDTHIERRRSGNYANIGHYGNGQRRTNQSFGYGQNNFVEVDIVVEEWVYDFGRRRLQQYLRFENGKLKEIKALGRGD